MSAQQNLDTPAGLTDAVTAAFAAGTREALTALLADDVRWGGERHGTGHECTSRDQAGDHYEGLLTSGMTLAVSDVEPVASRVGDTVFTARMHVRAADPEAFPPQMPVRLTVRNGLIADIAILDPPPVIEVLYFTGCPHFDKFEPHLRKLLDENNVTATVTLTRIETDEEAQAHRFLGSPSIRVNGRDVEPAANMPTLDGPISVSAYGMQCRLYRTDQGTTGVPLDQWILDALVDNPIHEAAVAAIHSGNVVALQQLLTDHPHLASTRMPRRGGRTLLHVATDWPGHHPHSADSIRALVAAGADPDSPNAGEHPETPLHWAASCDDVAAIDALLDAGADIDAPGAVIGSGTPMADATAFGQWNAARRLLERGARTTLFDAAALGLVSEVQKRLTNDRPNHEAITSSFWGACHGGYVTTAAVLLDAGADIDWVGYDDLTPLGVAHRSDAYAVVRWLEERGARTPA